MGSKLNAFWNIYSSKYFPVAMHSVARWCEIPGTENLSHIKPLWRCTATKTAGSSDPGWGFARETPTSIDPVFSHDTEQQTDDGMAISDLITSPPVLPWPSITKIMGWPKSLPGASRHDVSRGGGELRKLHRGRWGWFLSRLLIKASEHGADQFISTGEEGEVNQSLCSRFSFNSFLIISTASSGKNETGLKKMMSLRKHLTNFSSDEDLI